MVKLNDIQAQMKLQNKEVSDEEFIIDVLEKLPDARHKHQYAPYGMAIGFIERDLEEGVKVVTPFMVQQKLNQRYEKLKEKEEK